MAESFLEAQLQRIRALSERISQVQAYAEESRARFAELRTDNPLFDARDYRPISSMRTGEPSTRRRGRRRR